jgi:uncharacterized protein YcaQ
VNPNPSIVQMQNISLDSVLPLILKSQLLDGKSDLPNGKEGAARVIEELGYVQIDTISRVERAHHHILWTRVPSYQPAIIDELQARDKRIFEYWGHESSYLPMQDYRFYIPRMRGFADPQVGWHRQLMEKYQHLTPKILERIRMEGPLASKDFEKPAGAKRGGWWEWKPAKTALELLFWQGKLMVIERRGFQRVYDLTERVLPDWVDTCVPDEVELGQFYVRRALHSLAVAREREIRLHLGGATSEMVKKGLQTLLDAGEVVQLELAEDGKQPYFALTDTLNSKTRSNSQPLHILSPFDNLIIQRERTLRLFHFDFAMECYLPAEKRKLGYFLLPILWGDHFAGRMDVQADRKRKTLIIQNLVLEKDFHNLNDFLPLFLVKLNDYMKFNGCQQVEVIRTSPAKIKGKITRG